jgi:anti-anti-sigma factor
MIVAHLVAGSVGVSMARLGDPELLMDIEVTMHHSFDHLVVAGELDLATAPLLNDALGSSSQPVLVDLTPLAFIDSSGLNVLIANSAALARNQDSGKAVLIVPPGAVRRVFELTALDEVFDLVDSLDDSNVA